MRRSIKLIPYCLVRNHHITSPITIESAMIYHKLPLFFTSGKFQVYIILLVIDRVFYKVRKLSMISFTMNQASEAIAKPPRAISIVFLHFVLSCWRDPKRSWYAQIITNITAIVHAIHIRKFVAATIIFGISLRLTSQLLSFSSEILSQKIPVSSAAKLCTTDAYATMRANIYFIAFFMLFTLCYNRFFPYWDLRSFLGLGYSNQWQAL